MISSPLTVLPNLAHLGKKLLKHKFYDRMPCVVGAGDAAAYLRKNFVVKTDYIWAKLRRNLVRFEQKYGLK